MRNMFAGLVIAIAMAVTMTSVPAQAASGHQNTSVSQVSPDLTVKRPSKNPSTDIQLTFGWGVYLNVWGWEIKSIASSIVAAGGVAAIGSCSLVAKFPGIVQSFIRVVCTAVGVATVREIARYIIAKWRSGPRSGTCYQMKIVPLNGGTWHAVSNGNCSGV